MVRKGKRKNRASEVVPETPVENGSAEVVDAVDELVLKSPERIVRELCRRAGFPRPVFTASNKAPYMGELKVANKRLAIVVTDIEDLGMARSVMFDVMLYNIYPDEHQVLPESKPFQSKKARLLPAAGTALKNHRLKLNTRRSVALAKAKRVHKDDETARDAAIEEIKSQYPHAQSGETIEYPPYDEFDWADHGEESDVSDAEEEPKSKKAPPKSPSNAAKNVGTRSPVKKVSTSKGAAAEPVKTGMMMTWVDKFHTTCRSFDISFDWEHSIDREDEEGAKVTATVSLHRKPKIEDADPEFLFTLSHTKVVKLPKTAPAHRFYSNIKADACRELLETMAKEEIIPSVNIAEEQAVKERNLRKKLHDVKSPTKRPHQNNTSHNGNSQNGQGRAQSSRVFVRSTDAPYQNGRGVGQVWAPPMQPLVPGRGLYGPPPVPQMYAPYSPPVAAVESAQHDNWGNESRKRSASQVKAPPAARPKFDSMDGQKKNDEIYKRQEADMMALHERYFKELRLMQDSHNNELKSPPVPRPAPFAPPQPYQAMMSPPHYQQPGHPPVQPPMQPPMQHPRQAPMQPPYNNRYASGPGYKQPPRNNNYGSNAYYGPI